MRLIFLFLLCCQAYADESIELLGGSITWHTPLNGSNDGANTNKLSKDGSLIDNPLFGVRLTDTKGIAYDSVAVFGGENSIGKQMGGAMYSTGYVVNKWDVGLVVGAYLQNTNDFYNSGLQPFRVGTEGPNDICPIIGAEFNYKIDLSDNMYLKINNVITPVITNNSLSLGYTF